MKGILSALLLLAAVHHTIAQCIYSTPITDVDVNDDLEYAVGHGLITTTEQANGMFTYSAPVKARGEK